MPSFDIESKIDSHELTNAVDQSNRVISNRFDFKSADAIYEIRENKLALTANEAFQLDQMIPILKENLAKRSIDLKALKFGEKISNNNKTAHLHKSGIINNMQVCWDPARSARTELLLAPQHCKSINKKQH